MSLVWIITLYVVVGIGALIHLILTDKYGFMMLEFPPLCVLVILFYPIFWALDFIVWVKNWREDLNRLYVNKGE
ncbi:hypothetical protein P4J10_23245 [Bacillus cereus]|uniref:hypothetical protein n=1 Tax=Bacillus cereus group TaxID=86661 RepID=UPI000B44CBE7|nr:hypothetical protein [Bacillus thuringiensis]MEB9469512.1 hypothetical protein [Bacillus cereus]MRA82279.1 hypothetical protein [Bacillus thuringiensis]OUA18987.1 hypothetical protein BK776_28115 [Bacillus thuringiensis serovar aizawai]